MFLDILELWTEKKKKIGKTVLKMRPQKFTKRTYFVPIICQRLGMFFSSKYFSLHIFLLFCNLNSKISRNMCIWRHKVSNNPILPPWSPFCSPLSLFTDNLDHFFLQIWDHIIKKQFFLYTIFFSFLFQAPGYLETCLNGVTNCKRSKTARWSPFYLVKWSFI